MIASELDRLKLDNLALQINNLELQFQVMRSNYAALVAQRTELLNTMREAAGADKDAAFNPATGEFVQIDKKE